MVARQCLIWRMPPRDAVHVSVLTWFSFPRRALHFNVLDGSEGGGGAGAGSGGAYLNPVVFLKARDLGLLLLFISQFKAIVSRTQKLFSDLEHRNLEVREGGEGWSLSLPRGYFAISAALSTTPARVSGNYQELLPCGRGADQG
jgi:hypothetical protein